MPEAAKLDIYIKIFMAIVAVSSAVIGLYTFWRSTRTKAAEFLSDLHRAFFVETTYKEVREILDDESESAQAKMAVLVEKEHADFTDFLNFFELVAYMGEVGTLSPKDVEALLGYYLDILNKKSLLHDYVRIEKNSFQHLDMLLRERPGKLRWWRARLHWLRRKMR
jgi:hypothetical protein